MVRARMESAVRGNAVWARDVWLRACGAGMYNADTCDGIVPGDIGEMRLLNWP